MTIIYLFLLVISGVLLSYLLIKELSIYERLSFGIGLGILMYSLEYFLILKFGIRLNSNIIGGLVISSSSLLLLFNIYNRNAIIDDFKSMILIRFRNLFKGELKYLIILLSTIAILITAIATFWPISEWDALTLYDFRGKIYAEGLTFRDVQNLDSFDTFNAGYYFSYPPSTSLVHASFYILGSDYPQLIYPIIFFSLIIYFYMSISKFISRDSAILISSVLMLTNVFVNHASVPYTNLPFTYFYFVSTILLVEYITISRDIRKLILSGLFLAGSSWMRSVEPFYIVNILVLLFHILVKKKNLINVLIFVTPLIFVKRIWTVVQNEYATKSFLNNISYSSIFGNLFTTIPLVIYKALQSYVGFIKGNGLIFGILLLNTILYFISKVKYQKDFKKWLLIIIYSNMLFILAGTIAIGILIPGRSEIYDSISRFGIFLYPLILYVTGLSISEINIASNEK